MMRNKKHIRMFAAQLAAVLCIGSMSVTAFAGGGDGEPYYTGEPEDSAETTGGYEPEPLTPEGNMTLVDDIDGDTAQDKQFITVVTKNGNYFYIIIDRADEGENTVHFLNQVDERDLLSLMEEEETETAPPACTCGEKCKAGQVNTACPVCRNNLSECMGIEKAAEQPEPEPEQPAKKGNPGVLLLVLLILGGGGVFAYMKFVKPKQTGRISADPDDYLIDDEEYENEDVPETEDTEDEI